MSGPAGVLAGMRHSVRSSLRYSLVLLGVVAGVACSSTTGPGEFKRERQLAVIRFYQDPMLIEVPSVVSRGVDFEVAVRTFGGGCIAQGDTEVSIVGRTAEVRPFDVFVTQLPPNGACTDDLRYYLHRATLRFTEPGMAIVRVRGRAQPGNDIVVVERVVLVK